MQYHYKQDFLKILEAKINSDTFIKEIETFYGKLSKEIANFSFSLFFPISNLCFQTLLQNTLKTHIKVKFPDILSNIKPIVENSIKCKGSGFVSLDLPLLLFEDVYLGLTIAECLIIWDYMESIRDILIPCINQNSLTKLLFLRSCLSLMGRLSKNIHIEFYGKVAKFLTFALPLDEKSGQNIVGSINQSNPVTFDAKEASNFDDLSEINYFLYQNFWGIQKYLKDYNLLIKEWTNYLSSLDSILKIFDNFDPEVPAVDSVVVSHPSFLTHSSLLSLQVKDRNLRIQILTEILLINHSLDVKERQREEIQKYNNKIESLIKKCKDGSVYFSKLNSFLFQENRWIIWKRKRCSEEFVKESSQLLNTFTPKPFKLHKNIEKRLKFGNLLVYNDSEDIIEPIKKQRLEILDISGIEEIILDDETPDLEEK